MTEQQRPDEDVEGHGRRMLEDPEGTEESEDDVEGHRARFQQPETGDDDDVEGHMPRRPL